MKPSTKLSAITAEDVRKLCGEVEDQQVAAILATGATLEELEEAVAWAGGLDDVMGEERKPLTGAAAQIYDLLAEDLDEAEARYTPPGT